MGPERYWAKSFAPVMRVSKKFFEVLERQQHLTFMEALFPTLALHNNLTLKAMDPKFGGNLRWCSCWTSSEISKTLQQGKAVGLFHPAKWNETTHSFQGCHEAMKWNETAHAFQGPYCMLQ